MELVGADLVVSMKAGKVEIKFKVTSDNAGGKTVKKKVTVVK